MDILLEPQAFAQETITVGSTAVGFTAATYKPSGAGAAKRALVTVRGAQIAVAVGGTTPTGSTDGHLWNVGEIWRVVGINDITSFLAIRAGTTGGNIHVTYER